MNDSAPGTVGIYDGLTNNLLSTVGLPVATPGSAGYLLAVNPSNGRVYATQINRKGLHVTRTRSREA